MEKKYEFTGEVHPKNPSLKRIRAVRNFGAVKEGDLGGWIESEANLSHSCTCWVSDDAKVYWDARVYGNVRVYGNAEVYDNARVYNNALVYADAKVFGNAKVGGDAQVFGNAKVFGDVHVGGKAWVFGNAKVYGNAEVYDNAKVYGDAWACGNSSLRGDAWVFAYMRILWDCDKIVASINTSDGYTMTLDHVNRKISAGCRYFTFDEARAHWQQTRGSTALGKERLDSVDFLETRNLEYKKL
jgi:predicted acyltransferase (DUF342 family)